MAGVVYSFTELLKLLHDEEKITTFTSERCWKPRRCANSGKSLWLRKAVRKHTSSQINLHFGPFTNTADTWYTPAEGLIEQLKSYG